MIIKILDNAADFTTAYIPEGRIALPIRNSVAVYLNDLDEEVGRILNYTIIDSGMPMHVVATESIPKDAACVNILITDRNCNNVTITKRFTNASRC